MIPPFPFDPARALAHVQEICRIGPRVSGTEGMRRQWELLRAHFGPLCDRLAFQEFSASQVSRGGPVAMANVVASWGLDRPSRVMVCAHHDTRPIADREPDPGDWHRPFLGANDGASGVAVLMELARHVRPSAAAAAVGVDFVLFDGEEYVFDPEEDLYFFGSTHFAGAYRAGDLPGRYLGAVLLDMVAGAGAEFPVEAYSAGWAGGLAGEVWGIAGELGCGAFVPEVAQEVMDDHLPLNLAGIPAVVIIDASYPHWHRLTDTPEHCSAATLGQVGRVVGEWLRGVGAVSGG